MSEFMIRPDAKSIGLSPKGGRKTQTLLTAARHNLRDIQKELGADSHIDAGRIYLNEILAGPDTPPGVAALAQSLRDGIGYTPRRHDFTQAHEFLFTLATTTAVDTRAFFLFCLAFVVAEFGLDSVLSAVIHRDEKAPHLHILIIPISDGRYVGSSLITKPSLAKLIEKFAAAALKAFGVKVEKTLTGAERAQVTQAVHAGLKAQLERHIDGDLMAAILKAAGRNPASFMAALGIVPDSQAPANDGGAAFKRTALSTGKGGKTERREKPYGFEKTVFDDQPKPYGFESGRENAETIPCVVSPKEAPPLPASSAPQPAPALNDTHDLDQIDAGEVMDSLKLWKSQTQPDQRGQGVCSNLDTPFIETTTRHRDCDQSPDRFHDGNYCQPAPPPARLKRQAADGWVNAELATRSKAGATACHR